MNWSRSHNFVEFRPIQRRRISAVSRKQVHPRTSLDSAWEPRLVAAPVRDPSLGPPSASAVPPSIRSAITHPSTQCTALAILPLAGSALLTEDEPNIRASLFRLPTRQ